jgi:hypothetical protein
MKEHFIGYKPVAGFEHALFLLLLLGYLLLDISQMHQASLYLIAGSLVTDRFVSFERPDPLATWESAGTCDDLDCA